MRLQWFFIIPFIASAIAFCMPRISKGIAFLLSVIPLVLLLYRGTDWIGSDISYDWFSSLGIRFHLGIDSLSLVFLYLTAVIVPISILAQKSAGITSRNFFYGLILLLQGLLLGFFKARDLFVFTFFWEAMLLPLYFLIATWGGKEREHAAFKFILYMISGSVLMVIAVLALYFSGGTFEIEKLSTISENVPYAKILCAIFLLAFSIKTPLFPFHAWLPDAYCQGSTTATILLAAILSKAGIYGILRIGVGFFPKILMAWGPGLLILAIIGMLYGAFAAWGQTDYKRLIAYSSFSHVNFLLAGLFVFNEYAQTGAILQVINHAVTITGLFAVASFLELRIGTTSMGGATGLAKYLPRLCWVSLFFVLSAVALPGLNNFVSEVLILFGLFIQNPWLSGILGLTVILSVIYMLRWMHSLYFETPNIIQMNWLDMSGKEAIVATPLIALILWLGIYPAPVLRQIEPAAKMIAEKTL